MFASDAIDKVFFDLAFQFSILFVSSICASLSSVQNTDAMLTRSSFQLSITAALCYLTSFVVCQSLTDLPTCGVRLVAFLPSFTSFSKLA
jgi:hypothetical protein